MAGAEHPEGALPGGAIFAALFLDGEDEAGGLVETAFEDAAETIALFGVGEFIVHRVYVDGELPLFVDVFERVFVGGDDEVSRNQETGGEAFGELEGFFGGVAVILFGVGDPLIVAPEGCVVVAPVAGECPAGQGFTRVPFALAVMEEAFGGDLVAEAADELAGSSLFFRA